MRSALHGISGYDKDVDSVSVGIGENSSGFAREQMPIFEYECRGCHNQFELLVLATTTPACPTCHGTDLAKLLSLSSVSSDGTRQRSLGLARKSSKKVQRDKAHAEHEAFHHHHH